MAPAMLIAVSLVAEFCNAVTLLRLRCLSKEVYEAFDYLPFIESTLARWARGNQAVITDVRQYSVPLWKLLVATSDSDDDNIENHDTLVSLDGRRYMLRAPICDILNFMTTSTINIPSTLGYKCCDVIKLTTCMTEDDLTLKIYLFPGKDPDLKVNVKFYATINESIDRSDSEPSFVQASQPTNWPISPLNRRRVLAPEAVEGTPRGLHVTAHIGQGCAKSGAFIWRHFVPAFKRTYKYFTNGDGKCYLEIRLS